MIWQFAGIFRYVFCGPLVWAFELRKVQVISCHPGSFKGIAKACSQKKRGKMPFLVTSHPFTCGTRCNMMLVNFPATARSPSTWRRWNNMDGLFCFSHCHGIQLTIFRLQFIIFIMLISPFAIVSKKWACHFAVCSTCSEWFWNTSTCALAAAASAAGSVDFSKTPHTVHDAFNVLHSPQTTATTNNSSNNNKDNMITIIIVTTGNYNYMPKFCPYQKS